MRRRFRREYSIGVLASGGFVGINLLGIALESCTYGAVQRKLAENVTKAL